MSDLKKDILVCQQQTCLPERVSNAAPFPRMHRATVSPSRPASPDRREPWLPTRARTERKTAPLRKKQKHAMTDDASTATFNTHTHTQRQ